MNSLRLRFLFLTVATSLLIGQLHAAIVLDDLGLHGGGGVAWIHGLRRGSGGFANAEDRGDHQTAIATIGANYRLLPYLSLTTGYLQLETIENELSYPPDVIFLFPPPDRIAYRVRAVLAGVEVHPLTYGRFALELGAGAAFTRHSAEERGGHYLSPSRRQSGSD